PRRHVLGPEALPEEGARLGLDVEGVGRLDLGGAGAGYDESALAARGLAGVAGRERAERAADRFLVDLGELAREASGPLRPEGGGEVGEGGADARRRLVEDEGRRLGAEAAEELAPRSLVARREADEEEALGREAGEDERGDRRRRARDDLDAHAGGDRGGDQAPPRGGDPGRARPAHHRAPRPRA